MREAIFTWIRTRRISVTWSWLIGFTGAELDKCLKCGKRRWCHPKDHQFVEEE